MQNIPHRACEHCKRRKIRCERLPGESSCVSCTRLRRECVFPAYSVDIAYVQALEARVRDLEQQLAAFQTKDALDTSLESISNGVNNTPEASMAQSYRHLVIHGNSSAYDRYVLNTIPTPPGSQPSPLSAAPNFEPLIMTNTSCLTNITVVEFYFDKLHPALPLFNRALFMLKLETQPPILLLAIFVFAASAILFNPMLAIKIGITEAMVKQSYKDLLKLILKRMKQPTFEVAQAVLLLSQYYLLRGEVIDAWIWSGVASRLAQLLHLNVDNEQHIDDYDDDVRRRLFWSIFVKDQMLSIGTRRPPVLHHHFIQVSFCVPDWAWQLMRAGQPRITLPRITLNNWQQNILNTRPGELNYLAGFGTIVVLISIASKFSSIARRLEQVEKDRLMHSEQRERDLLEIYQAWQEIFQELTTIRSSLVIVDLDRYQKDKSLNLQGPDGYNLLVELLYRKACIMSYLPSLLSINFPVRVFPWIGKLNTPISLESLKNIETTQRFNPETSLWINDAVRFAIVGDVLRRDPHLICSPLLYLAAFMVGIVLADQYFLYVSGHGGFADAMPFLKTTIRLLRENSMIWKNGRFYISLLETAFETRGLKHHLNDELLDDMENMEAGNEDQFGTQEVPNDNSELNNNEMEILNFFADDDLADETLAFQP